MPPTHPEPTSGLSAEPSAAWRRYQATMTAPPTLWAAARANDLALLDQLIDQLLEARRGETDALDARDPRGYAPLMLAAYAGHVEAVERLLAAGADPDAPDHAGNTVLMGAAWKGHVALVTRLLAAGADPAARNLAGQSARDIAALFGRGDVVAALDAAPTPHHPTTR